MERSCNVCGAGFTAARSDARYCSPRCRVQAHRARTQPDRPKARRRPITDQAYSAGWELRKAVERIDRIFADGRFEKHRAEVIAALGPHVDYAEDVIGGACSEVLGYSFGTRESIASAENLEAVREDRAKRMR